MRGLVRDTAIYGLSSILIRAQQIVLIPIYTRYLVATDYGVIETVAIAGTFINMAVTIEIAQGMSRYISDAPDAENQGMYAKTAFAFASLCYLLFFCCVLLLGNPASVWLFHGQAGFEILAVASASVALNGLFAIKLDMLRWSLRPLPYFLASVVSFLIGAVVGIAMVANTQLGALAVFVGQMAGSTAGLVIALGTMASTLWRARLSITALRCMLAFSGPLVFSSLAMYASSYIDRVVVGSMLGTEALGIYAVAARFASAIGILTVALQAALSPLVYRNWRVPKTPERLARIFRLYGLVMTPLVGGICLFSGEIIRIMAGPDFQAAATLLPIMVLSSMFFSLYIFSPGLFLGNRTIVAAGLSIVSAIANSLLCLLTVSQIGISGAAISSVLVSAGLFAGHVLLGRANFNVPFKGRQMLVTTAILVAMSAIGAWLGTTNLAGNLAVIGIKCAGLLTALIAVWRFGLTVADRSAALSALSSQLTMVLGARR